MDRRRAAGALLALAACFATSAAAPTAGDHTALDLIDEHSEGCYYNFQHYGEGDRIMTNEPCLNCTCHNRMLMCYLRVCPFTKAIGQDCTVEKRADQCCPIVTCPDVPVDLLTSTSTSSPAEYGGTGVGKVDNYGCSINGKYFPEGAKVPPTPNKPCEHCYCIRNMTTCVMQECTLHVDGCTPIYHKDVCCPVRYFCDHPEDEMPALDDMTTTVRPTPGFLLTTTPPTEELTTLPAKRDCVEDDHTYPDGALIKREKPCEHCYCMKGDIVCVVQECGTPMENEGKNCTSLPPREGQCCPDTYICEGDELSTEPNTEEPFIDITTLVPPRIVSGEGSGYRKEPDEEPDTAAPTFSTDIEGSGEEGLGQSPIITDNVEPEKETTDKELNDRFEPTEENEFIPKTTQASLVEMSEEPMSEIEQTTRKDEPMVTEPILGSDQDTTPSIISSQDESSKPSLEEETTPKHETKATEPSYIDETTRASVDLTETDSSSPIILETTSEPEKMITEPSAHQTDEPFKSDKEEITEEPMAEVTLSEDTKTTEQPSPSDQEAVKETSEPPLVTFTATSETEREQPDQETMDGRRTSPVLVAQTTETPITVDEHTTTRASPEPSVFEETTPIEREKEQDQGSEQNTVPASGQDDETTEPSKLYNLTPEAELEVPSSTSQAHISDESTVPTDIERTTPSSDSTFTEGVVQAEDKQPHEPESATSISKEDEYAATTVPAFRKEDEATTLVDITTRKSSEEPSPAIEDFTKEIIATPSYEAPTTEKEYPLPHEQDISETTKFQEVTTESLMELSTFTHDIEKDSTQKEPSPPIEVSLQTEKVSLPETTTVNPEDNEIDEVPSPGRIPGEGDCLLEGSTFKNDSSVPSNNKCHSACKCVSSIIKCDPIICSPPPEYMDNCQPRYDTPDSCCPTYICDGKETIPPQPHSQMSGTESPFPSPSVECNGDQCEIVDDKLQPTVPPKAPEKLGAEDCGSEGCSQKPEPAYPEGCTAEKCTLPTESCTDGKCELPLPPTEEKPTEVTKLCNNPDGCKEVIIHETVPPKGISQDCQNQENCKGNEIPEASPVPCIGDACTSISGPQLCDGDKCAEEPEIIPSKDKPQLCKNEEDCKQTQVPVATIPVCEGESCTHVKEDCSSGECKVVATEPQTTHQGAVCSEESGCKKPEETTGEEKESTDCTTPECMQDKPTAPAEAITPSDGLGMAQPTLQEQATRQPIEGEEGAQTSMPELPEESVFERTTTEISRQTIKEEFTEVPVDKTTEVPDLSTQEISDQKQETPDSSQKEKESESPVTAIPQDSSSITPEETVTISPQQPIQEYTEQHDLEKQTEKIDGTVESHEIYTESPKEPIDEEREATTKSSENEMEPEVSEIEGITKIPEVPSSDQDQSTDSSKLPTEGVEDKIEEDTEKDSTKTPLPVTEKVFEKEPELSEITTVPEISATEPSIIGPHKTETELPEVPVTGTERITTAPPTELGEDIDTPAPEKDTTGALETQTESAQVTDFKETVTDKSQEDLTTNAIPDRSGEDEGIEISTGGSRVPEIETEPTKVPEISEIDENLMTTEIPDAVTKFDTDMKEPLPTKASEPDISVTQTSSPELPVDIIPFEDSKTEAPEKTPQEIISPEETETKAPEEIIPSQETETKSPEEATSFQETETKAPEETIPSQETETKSPEEIVPTRDTDTKTPEEVIPTQEIETRLPEDVDPTPTQETDIKPYEGTITPQEVDTKTPEDMIPTKETETKTPEEIIPTKETETKVPEEPIPSQETETKSPEEIVPTKETETKVPEETIPSQETETKSPEEIVPTRDTDSKAPEEVIPTQEIETRLPEEIAPTKETETRPHEETITPQEVETKAPEAIQPSQETHTKAPEETIPSQETETESSEEIVPTQGTVSELPEETVTSEETETKAPEKIALSEESETKAPEEESVEIKPSQESQEIETATPETIVSGQETGTKVPEETIPSQETETKAPEDIVSSEETETKAPEQVIPDQESATQASDEQMPSQETQTTAPESFVTNAEELITTPPIATDDREKHTESPMSLVTELGQTEETTAHSISSSEQDELPNVIPEAPTSKPVSDEFEKDYVKTEKPEPQEPEKKKPDDQYPSIPDREPVKEKEVEEKPDSEFTSATQKPTTEEPASVSVSLGGLPGIQETITTNTPLVTDAQQPATEQEPEVFDSYTTESSHTVHPEPTTLTPTKLVPTEKEIEKVTGPPEPLDTGKDEISTETSDEDVTSSHDLIEQNIVTDTPEPSIPKVTETPDGLPENEITKKPEENENKLTGISELPDVTKTTTSASPEITTEQEEIRTSPPELFTTVPEKTAMTEKELSEEEKEESTTQIPSKTHTDSPTVQESQESETTEQTTGKPESTPTTKKEEYPFEPVVVTETQELITSRPEVEVSEEQPEADKEEKLPTESVPIESTESSDDKENVPVQTSRPELEYSETTPYLVELEEHTHKIDEETPMPTREPTISHHEPEGVTDVQTESPQFETEEPSIHKEGIPVTAEEPTTLPTLENIPVKSTEPSFSAETPISEVSPESLEPGKPIDRVGPEDEKEKESETTTPKPTFYEEESTTVTPSFEIEKLPEKTETLPERDTTSPKPQFIPVETTAPEEEFIPVTSKVTTVKSEDETPTPPQQFDKTTKIEEKPSDLSPTTPASEVAKPEELQPTDEVPVSDDDSHFPPSGGYNQEPDYVEEDQAFGPGTCRYGGKVYVSAQQIPRDDPCDFCFCFRSDIICLQQSCPPPIHGCHEEPIQGFCCPRYECPVSMATTLNVTTTTTTTTTTLPPHFLPHAYKGAAQRRGCQIKGHTYKVGEVVRASSGPCLHCTCGGDGQMKCDPKQCTPEPMLRQMIAAAVSAKRRR